MPEKWAGKKKLGFPVPTWVWLKEDKYYNIVKEEFLGENAQKFFHTEKLIKLLDDHKTARRTTAAGCGPCTPFDLV